MWGEVDVDRWAVKADVVVVAVEMGQSSLTKPATRSVTRSARFKLKGRRRCGGVGR